MRKKYTLYAEEIYVKKKSICGRNIRIYRKTYTIIRYIKN